MSRGIVDKEFLSLPPEIVRLKSLAKWMDSKFTIPGTSYTFGLDPILNLIPGFGQGIDILISLYIVYALYKNGTSGALVGKMVWNVLLDSVVGAIPIVGYIFDFAFKANKRNLILAEEYYSAGLHKGTGVVYFLPFVLLFLLALAIIFTITYYLTTFVFNYLAGQ